jgi:hypothetical protein
MDEKGKPVVRPGRKTRGSCLRIFKIARQPAAIPVIKTRMEVILL